MTHFEFLQTANAIAGLGILVFFSYRLKAFLIFYLRTYKDNKKVCDCFAHFWLFVESY